MVFVRIRARCTNYIITYNGCSVDADYEKPEIN